MITPLFFYFFKVNIALAVFYLGYKTLFQRDTFFYLRRITLLSMLLLACLYPLPNLSHWLSMRTHVTEIITYYSAILPIEVSAQSVNKVLETNWQEMGTNILLWIYLTGILILSIRCLIELAVIVRTYRSGKKSIIRQTHVCLLPHPDPPYSFFGWIFIPEDICRKSNIQEILIHEKQHAKQWHSLDVLLAEVTCILCWINPFAWLLKKEIHINHEYIADEHVIQSGFNKKQYQYHLIGLEHPHLAIASLHNYFSVLLLKKRITMLNKRRTSGARKVKYLALIPMALGLMFVNNIDVMARVENVPKPQQVQTISQTVPLPPEKEKIYEETPIAPQYPGGDAALLRFMSTNVKYPVESITKKEQGKVVLSFIINKDGSTSDFTVLEPLYPLLDAEALRVAKQLKKWTPGKLDNGQAVRVKMTMPVMFRLQ